MSHPERTFRFLDDRPIETADRDIFRVHSAYATALAQAIETCTTPFAIGLFGTWGSGKTSVVNFLAPLVKQAGHRWVNLDVWKFSRDPVKRWVLLQMQEQLALEDYTFEGRTLQSHLEFEEELVTESRPFLELPRLQGKLLLILASIVLLGAGVTAWLLASGLIAAGSIVGTLSGLGLLSLLVQGFLSLLARLVVRQEVKHIKSVPAFSPEKFEAIFIDMVRKALGPDPTRKLIVVFDNLDRCPEDAAVETLSAIKTFLEVPGCVYIVPCDEEALTTHILRSYESYQTGAVEVREGQTAEQGRQFAREFLRKFFQLALRLPEIAQRDYERFIDVQVESAGACDFLSPRTRDIALIAYGRETPRKVKRFINDFLGYYILGQALEGAGKLELGSITSHLEFLAKMVVIYHEWPQAIEKIKTNPDILQDVTEVLRAGAAAPSEYDLDAGLIAFLKATQDVDTPPNVLPFIYLKRAEYERDPELVARVTDSLAQADEASFVGLLRESPERAENAVRVAIDKLRYWHRGSRLQELNAVRVLMSARSEIPEVLRSDFIDAVWGSLWEVAKGESFEGLLRKFEVSQVLDFAEDLRQWQQVRLLESYLQAFEPSVAAADFHSGLLEALVEKGHFLSPEHIDRLATLLAQRYTQDEAAMLPILEHLGRRLCEAGLISASLPAAIAANFSVQPDDLNRLRIGAYLEVRASADQDAKSDLSAKLVAALAPSRSASLDEIGQFALDVLKQLGSEGFDGAQADALGSSLVQQMQNAPPALRGPWTCTALALWDIIPESHKSPFRQIVGQTVSQPDASQVGQFLDQLSTEDCRKLLELQEVRRALKEQASKFDAQYAGGAKQNRKSVLSRLPKAELAQVLPEIVDGQFGWDVEAAFETALDAFSQNELRPGVLARLAVELLNRFVRGMVALRAAPLVMLAEFIADKPTLAKSQGLVDLVADLSGELIKHNRPSGGAALIKLTAVLSEERKRALSEELLDDLLAHERAGESLVAYSEYLNVVASYEDALNSDTYKKANDLGRRALGPAKPDDDVRVVLGFLARLTQIEFSQAVKTELRRLRSHPEFGSVANDLLQRR
ncbi:MAG: P-loop NTPase fold protein [Bacillota bacterium]|nr:P-loop NTPase fold protein [Bacillota bacterium]